MSSLPLLFFSNRTVYGKWIQHFLYHSTGLLQGTLCPISTLKQQLTNLKQTHVRCSLHCHRWTVEARSCSSVLRSFKESTHRTNEWTKQLLRLKSWLIKGRPQQGMEFHRLWRTLIVLKCSYLFQLFDFYWLLLKCFLFSEFFCFFWSMILSKKVGLLQQLLCKVTCSIAAEAAIYISTGQNLTLPYYRCQASSASPL